MSLPFLIINSLGFLVTKKKIHKKEVENYEGTAFFVSVPSETSGRYVYLVTAKHVIEGAKKEGRSTFYLRLNVVDYKRDDIKLTGKWVYSKNEDVDVAVMSIEPPDKNYYFWDDIPYDTPDKHVVDRANMFADHDVIMNFGIGIGDEVRVVGLFSEQTGNERNIPVARSGIIAAMPDEPLEVVIGGKKRRFNAHLIEVRSIGGLSGSPVFVLDEIKTFDYEFTHQLIPTSEYRYFLLGMIRGHWDYKKQYSMGGIADKELDTVNMGMAYITPIQDVIDVLYGDEMKEQRKRDDEQAEYKSQAIVVEDSKRNAPL